ncbi:MAG: hypothetical protein P4L51_15190 [Puia sp.]|nr:hypothetical protein [Puia sp.]
MLFQAPTTSQSFNEWLRTNSENRLLLRLSAAIIIGQFLLFKFFYPFPNFMPPDSYSYLEAAFLNQMINIWAIGYSKFLRFFSSLTNSDLALVWFQYILLEASLLYFLFSARFLLSLGKWLFRVLVALSIMNPMVSQISNFIGSDTLFTALSIIWFTQLMWILFRPNCRLLFWHAIVLFIAFTVRYNSLYYPIISIIVIVLSNLKTGLKWLSVGMITLLLGCFIVTTELAYRQETGYLQYSAFGGWQMAANALYGYAHTKPDSPENVPVKFRELHSIVNKQIESISHIPDFLRPDHNVSVYYLWDFNSPLRLYMNEKWKKDSTGTYFKHWASMAPLYAEYGRYLILHHPIPFTKYFLWPNLIKYYSPPLGFMGSYNLKNEQVDPIAAKWFGWNSNKISTRFKGKDIDVIKPFPIIIAVSNLIFALSFIGFIMLGGMKRSGHYIKRLLWWIFLIWLSNMLFSVFSAPIELRYQLFPILVTLFFLIILLSFIIEKSRTVNEKIVHSNETLSTATPSQYEIRI